MINHAKKFIKEYSLTKINLTSSRLEQIIEEQGFIIICFDRHSNNDDVIRLLNALNLSNMIKSHNGFSYEDEDSGFVFIKNKLTEQERTNTYLHELAHIHLKHTRFSGNEILEEFEAETFSICVKALLQIKHVVKLVILFLLIAAIGIIGATIDDKEKEPNSDTPHTIEETIKPIQSPSSYTDTVYVTKSGKKYHKRNCRHIRNSDTIFDISIEKAANAGYEPCKDCFSELY